MPPLLPVLFLGHGSPMNTIEDGPVRRSWQELGQRLPRPKAILCISAHWETRGVYVGGAEHPETLGAMTNLAISYGAAGRLPEAILLQEQSLAIKRRVLPPNHPYLAAALGNLANFYERDGRTVEADALRKELAGKQ